MISILPAEPSGPAQPSAGPGQKTHNDQDNAGTASPFASLIEKSDQAETPSAEPAPKPTDIPNAEQAFTALTTPSDEPSIETADGALATTDDAALGDTDAPKGPDAARIETDVRRTETAPKLTETRIEDAHAPQVRKDGATPQNPAPDTDTRTRTATETRAAAAAGSVDAITTDNRPAPDLARATKLTGTRTEADGQRVPSTASVLPTDSDDTLRIIRDQDTADLRTTDVKLPQPQTTTGTASAIDKVLATGLGRDAPALVTEPLISFAQATQTSGPTLATAGLTPTAPAVQVAAPTDITSIILNAVKNGVEPQEQLVVQLDPPELGRVMIDFKFDAQGMQQITVTAENPEALKRLRELHFELTEALKENGLSEKNLSFHQHTDDQPSRNWAPRDTFAGGSGLALDQAVPAPPQHVPARNNTTAPNRLDLTL